MKYANISVIVPFFNRRHTILDALASIDSQSLRPQQLIVVDDGSTDGGGEAVLRWIETVRGAPEFRLLRQANAGVAAARNHGFSHVGEDQFVAFLDSDDLWPADFLERTHSALHEREDAVAATCDQQYVFADGAAAQTIDCSGLAINPGLWMLKVGAGISSATLFRSQAIRRRGGFPNLVTGEDAALYMPLSLDGPWLHVPGQPVVFQVGVAERLGDEGNLSRKFTDNWRCWANIYEHFLTRGDGHVLLGHPEFKQSMALTWYKAGKEMWETHAPSEALACFQKSWAWNPWRRRCYMRMLRAWLKRIGQVATPACAESRATPAPVRR